MLLEIVESKLTKDELHCLLKFSASVRNLESRCKTEDYCWNYEAIESLIQDKVATAIANEYLKQHTPELMSKVKQQDIVNGITLKLVEGFSLNR